MTDAIETCESVLSEIRNSRLNFLVQETPYSAFITIREKFRKGSEDSACKTDILARSSSKITEFEKENLSLKVKCEEMVSEIKSTRSENLILQNRLAKAEEIL